MSGDEGRWCVVDGPKLVAARLMLLGESTHVVVKPSHVIVHVQVPVDVGGHVVPRKHSPTCSALDAYQDGVI